MPDTCLNCLLFKTKECDHYDEIGPLFLRDTAAFKAGAVDLPCNGDDLTPLEPQEMRQVRRAVLAGDTATLGAVRVQALARVEARPVGLPCGLVKE